MKKILFLMGRYFPKASPNTLCVQNIIDSISKEENEVYVLCYEDYLKDEVHSKNVTKLSRGLLHSSIYKNEDKKGKTAALKKKCLHYVLMGRQLLTYSQWPLTDPLFTKKELCIAKKIVEKEKIDIVVAVHFPLSSLIVASQLKNIYPHIKYYSYFLDSLSGGSVPKLISKSRFDRQAEAWERKVTQNADKIIFMEASREYHSKLYAGSEQEKHIEYLDLPMLREQKVKKYSKKVTTEFVYIGSLASSIRSPEFFLRVFESSENTSWRLTFVGDDSCDAVNNAAKKDARIKVVGRCPHEEALQYEEGADILLNFGNNNPNLTPSKIFEYMSWGKKIISTYPIENESSLQYLRRYPKALLLNERETNLSKTVEMIEAFTNQEDRTIEYSELAEIFKKNTPEAFVELLDQN